MYLKLITSSYFSIFKDIQPNCTSSITIPNTEVLTRHYLMLMDWRYSEFWLRFEFYSCFSGHYMFLYCLSYFIFSCNQGTTLRSDISDNLITSSILAPPTAMNCAILSRWRIFFPIIPTVSSDTTVRWQAETVTKTSSGQFSTLRSPFQNDR